MFTFTSLQGAQSESSASQSLLELDGGVKILIDVGWDEAFNVSKLKELEKQVPTLSIILLTHSTVSHLAAFAHCCKHFPLFTRIPIYATTPVISLGRTLLQDLYSSTPLASTIIPPAALSEASYSYSKSISGSNDPHILLQPPTNEEIASYFSLIHPLKYSQPHQPLPSPFSPPLNGLTITAYNAGHTLGGTIWHIQHGLESIVYAVDWNQARENVLAGAAWLAGAGAGGAEVIEQLRKPTALICSSRGSDNVALAGGRAKRDELLLDMIRSAVTKGGIVLIPTDSSARVLELAYLLERAWRVEDKGDPPLRAANLYLASKNIHATMRYARSMLEWMDDGIIREFESLTGGQQKQSNGEQESRQQGGAVPFDFKYLRLLERKSQIDRVLSNEKTLDGKPIGKVILASDTSLEWGFSREVLKKIAADNRNLVILTERMSMGESGDLNNRLARVLWSWWEERRDGVALEPGQNGENLEQVYGGGREIEMRDAKRVPLEGTDLAVYQQWLATQRQLQTTLQSGGATSLESAVDVVDDASSESSSDTEDEETEHQGKALNISATMGQANRKKIGLSDEDLGINVLIRRKGIYDYDVRGKKGREKMFPIAIRRRRTDDFGELIRPEDFLRAEERDEVDGQDMQLPDTKDTLGKKRKWDDVATTTTDRRLSNGGGKRQLSDGGIEHGSPSQHESALMDDDDYDPEELVEEEIVGPSRVEFSTETITVNLRLAVVDFAGLHDKRSLHLLIPLIQPRKLILVSGLKDETLALASDCHKLLTTHTGSSGEKGLDVYTPEIGVSVDASVDTNAWVVKLTDTLVKRLRWQNVRGLGIVTLTGRLESPRPEVDTSPDAEGANKRLKMLKGETEETPTREVLDAAHSRVEMPLLDILPSSMAAATRSLAQPLHVGDMRLADLRKIMQASGHTAEFRGEGILLIDGSVIVRKSGTGRIEVESIGFGAGSAMLNQNQKASFYAVKAKIYEGLAVVAGVVADRIGSSPDYRIDLVFAVLLDDQPPPAYEAEEEQQEEAPVALLAASPGPLYQYQQLPHSDIDRPRVVIGAWPQHDMVGRGYNPVHGFDTSGPPPPGFNPAQPTGIPQYSAFFAPPAPPLQAPVFQQQPAPAFAYPAFASTTATPVLVQPNYPFPPPNYAAVVSNGGLQAVSFQSGTGGPVAPPPGYNYLFHSEHCKFHVFKTPIPPWQAPVCKEDPTTHVKLLIPTNITVKELMQNLGCNNADPKKNKIYELAEIGGGRWSRGLTMCGDDKERMKKKITEFGWDKTRTGKSGEKPVVWLWLSKG
ncbi:hypothetical protein B7463_g8645, partial [Scytalidium lignicola]